MAKRVNVEEQRRRIAQSAFRVLARDGLEGLSLRQVAKEAGCTTGLISHWFTSKEDLVMAAWRETMRREHDRAERLRAEGRLQADVVLLHMLPTTPELRREELVWQAFGALAISNPAVRKAYNRQYDYARRTLSGLLAPDGSRDEEAEEIADLLVAATDGIAKMAALNPARWPPERQREALRRLIEPHLGASRAGRSPARQA